MLSILNISADSAILYLYLYNIKLYSYVVVWYFIMNVMLNKVHVVDTAICSYVHLL